MPITKSAKKALRGSKRKHAFNEFRKDAMKKAVKTAKKTIGGEVKMTAEALAKAYQAIDKAAKRGVIKKNTAARKKSRLTKALAKAK